MSILTLEVVTSTKIYILFLTVFLMWEAYGIWRIFFIIKKLEEWEDNKNNLSHLRYKFDPKRKLVLDQPNTLEQPNQVQGKRWTYH